MTAAEVRALCVVVVETAETLVTRPMHGAEYLAHEMDSDYAQAALGEALDLPTVSVDTARAILAALDDAERVATERAQCGVIAAGRRGGRGASATAVALAALDASEARTAWQPMDTAPRDGTRVLALMDGLPIIAVRGLLGWYDDEDRRVTITAWMRLPEPPHG